MLQPGPLPQKDWEGPRVYAIGSSEEPLSQRAPDLIPAGHFPDNAVRHADKGIEIKASRCLRGWQGHNPEDTWLLVFMFDSNRHDDAAKGVEP